ncbi:RNA polymerase sigma-70 factor [Parapedobacter sp. ISTM3]|nr:MULTISPECIES: RNA polymerase sigma-70 factor [Parapedobacter]MBK1440715.1 RNA polymerase sigma-70 factor [Parapedobacter sp. ISTM3]
MPNKRDLSDKGLILGIKAGEEWAFRAAFDRYYNRLLRFAVSYLHDADVAEDIAQDTFILLWEYRSSLQEDTPHLFAFLVQVVKLKMLNSMEKKRRRYQIEQHLFSRSLRQVELDMHTLQTLSISTIYLSEIERLVGDTLAHVPEQTRMIFNLSREQGLSNREIADKIGKTEKTVEYHIGKVLKLLRPKLSDYLKVILFFGGF